MEQVADRLQRSWLKFKAWDKHAIRVPRAIIYGGLAEELRNTKTAGGWNVKVSLGELEDLRASEIGVLGSLSEALESAAAVATGIGASGSGFITVDGFARMCSSFGISIAQPAFDPADRTLGTVRAAYDPNAGAGGSTPARAQSQWSDCAGPCMLAMSMARAERWSLQLSPAKDLLHCGFNVFGFSQPWVVVDDEEVVPGTHPPEEDSCLGSVCAGITNVLTCGSCCGLCAGEPQRSGPPPPLDERCREDPGAHLFVS